jgi:hypothetical protein
MNTETSQKQPQENIQVAVPPQSSQTRRWFQRTAPALFIGTLQGLVQPTVMVVFSSTFAGISRSFIEASTKSVPEQAALFQFGLALSAIARILSIVALVTYAFHFMAITFATYASFPRAVRSSQERAERVHIAQVTKSLAETQKELAEAQRDLSQTKAQRERNERLLALTSEQVDAVKGQIGEDVRRSSKWPLILSMAGLLVAIAGVVVAFVLAP